MNGATELDALSLLSPIKKIWDMVDQGAITEAEAKNYIDNLKKPTESDW